MAKIVFFFTNLVFMVLALLPGRASAHHVYGIEVSPAFEIVHGLAEPLLCALGGGFLAVFLLRRTKGSLAAALVFGGAALALTLASVLEEGAGTFLLWDALAATLFYALAKRGLRGERDVGRF